MLAAPPFIDGARALGHVAVVALADHDEGDALPIEGCIEREPRGRRLVAGGLGVVSQMLCRRWRSLPTSRPRGPVLGHRP